MILQTKNGNEVLAYTKEEREQALTVSLTSLAKSLGYTPVRQGRHYSLKEMDSIVIYNDASWNRWSGKGRINSGSQIDFLLEFGPVSSVPEAINYLLSFKGETVQEVNCQSNPAYDAHNECGSRELVLPPRNKDQKRLFAYLIQTRGLSQEVVYDFVKRNLIYEDAVHHNIVYCGRDPDGVVKYAGMRGTADIYGKKFKCDVPGNDKNYGVNIVNKQSSELKVFESVIDCMSYIDMYHDNTSNKLILGMVEDNPLEQFLRDYDHIKSISFCLDNDEAGQRAIYGDEQARSEKRSKGMYRIYQEKGYEISVEIPPSGKDFNEALLNQKKDNQEISGDLVEELGKNLLDNVYLLQGNTPVDHKYSSDQKCRQFIEQFWENKEVKKNTEKYIAAVDEWKRGHAEDIKDTNLMYNVAKLEQGLNNLAKNKTDARPSQYYHAGRA